MPEKKGIGHQGRPRSEDARLSILRAAFDVLRSRGFRELTIEGVAKLAGVGKTTIYRRWESKNDLVLDAVNDVQIAGTTYPQFSETIPPEESLIQEVRGIVRYFSSDAGSAYLDLVAESRFDSALAERISESFVMDKRTAAAAILKKIDVGAGDEFLDKFMDMLWGAIYYRVLVLHDMPTEDQIEELAQTALRFLNNNQMFE